ncbi:hypothetical protein SAY86_016979 [Trapa natans]|uniref:glucan endo-1,3-beta-D-glucosidase n=1 Tax=Trapa natans TaxID=22666 RepID=A0AAN7LP77_TRANT|nr:hypothetical protein SAY86_016979 [Trapa natans]
MMIFMLILPFLNQFLLVALNFRYFVQKLDKPGCFSFPTGVFSIQGFAGAYGINYGRLADNIPSPDEVVRLLRQLKIRNIRIFDSDHTVLQAFSRTGLNLVIGLNNGLVKDINSSADHAMNWVKDNVQSFLPNTRIRGIAIGNEILGGSDSDLYGALVGAMKNVHDALRKLKLHEQIQITTAHSQAVFSNSYPPSSCRFRDDIIHYMKPVLEFFQEIGSPFCLNAYPFLSYMGDPENIDINYALFEPNNGTYDPITDLHYDNMLDAQIDAAYAALESAGYNKMEVIITETGWASKGDSNEVAATVRNARTYNYNLRKRLAKRKGTPMRPKSVLKAYIFALFNEYQKPGPTSERNFGLFQADGTIAYNIGFQGIGSSAYSLKDFQACYHLSLYAITLASSAAVLLLLTRLL